MSRPSLQALGETSFARSEKVSAELLALTYGSFVRQLLLDYEDPEQVNKQLDTIGYNIGVRLVDDFLAKSKINHCNNFTETAEVISKVAFKMFLGIPAVIGSWSADKKTFGLMFDDNPLSEFTELPEDCKSLWYSNVLCGVIRGALEIVNMKVECKFARCRLRGDDQNEIKVSLHEILTEQVCVDNLCRRLLAALGVAILTNRKCCGILTCSHQKGTNRRQRYCSNRLLVDQQVFHSLTMP